MDINLKSIILAGIGSVAYTYEKSADMVETLVKKGELTVNQGKELNEELKRVLEKEKEEHVDSETIENILKDIEDIKARLEKLENNI